MEPNALARLSVQQRESLKKGNVKEISDILLSSPQELARKCKCSTAEAQKIIDLLYTDIPLPPLRQLEDVKHEGSEAFSTGEPALDEALGGGIRPGMIWEVVGESAAGKTQFALQLALSVQLPTEQKGLNGSACYLTTSATLPTTRLVQISESHPLLSPSDCSLKDIHTISAPTIVILIRVLSEMLPAFIAQSNMPGSKPVKLLVIDALAELFHTSDKTTTKTLVERSKNIAHISSILHTLATKHQIAVLVLNEVVDVFERDYSVDPGDSDLLYKEQSRWFARAHSIPGENKKEASLGLAWANQVNVRILLSRTGRRRYMDDTVDLPAKRHKPEERTSPASDLNRGTTDNLTLVRRLSIIFSSVSHSASLDYIVTEAGISVLPGETQLSYDHSTFTSSASSSEKATHVVDVLNSAPCSQISPLDVGIAEERFEAEENAKQAGDVDPQEDEWDKYWASDDISADLYDKADLESINPTPLM